MSPLFAKLRLTQASGYGTALAAIHTDPKPLPSSGGNAV